MVLLLNLNGKEKGKLIIKAEGGDRYPKEYAKSLLTAASELFAIALSNSLRHQQIKSLKDMLSEDCRYLQRELQEISGTVISPAEFQW